MKRHFEALLYLGAFGVYGSAFGGVPETLTEGIVLQEGVFYTNAATTGKIYYDHAWEDPVFDINDPAAIAAAIADLAGITDPALLEKTVASLLLAGELPGADKAAIEAGLIESGTIPDGVAENGIYYADGEPANGLQTDGITYVAGEPANGQITEGGIYYAAGEPANGTQADGVNYSAGSPTNGQVNGTGTYYFNGKAAYGNPGNGSYYFNGVLLGTADSYLMAGMPLINAGVNTDPGETIYFADGTPLTGDPGTGKYYWTGGLFRGIAPDTGITYSKGLPASGTYYTNGVKTNGLEIDGNGFYSVSGQGISGDPGNGIYYSNGYPANGTYNGKDYVNGLYVAPSNWVPLGGGL